MKQFYRLIAFAIIALLACLAASAVPSPKPNGNETEKEQSEKSVDSGSFGVFMSGHRVGTETFSIVQDQTGSVIKSEFKTENDPKNPAAVQSSELHLTPGGDIRRYEWKEMSPEAASSVVVPNDQFLSQKWSTGPKPKNRNSHTCSRPPPASSTITSSSIASTGLEVPGRQLQAGERAGAVPYEAESAVRHPGPTAACLCAAERRVPWPGKNRLQRQPAGIQQNRTRD